MREKKIKRKGSRSVLILLTLLLLCAHNFAQTGERKITGKVTDAGTGQPVANASIMVKGRQHAVASDINGVFTVTVRTGETLEISSVGHTPQIIKIGAGSENLNI